MLQMSKWILAENGFSTPYESLALLDSTNESQYEAYQIHEKLPNTIPSVVVEQ